MLRSHTQTRVQAIRPHGATILMGKNTLMKRCIRLYCENNNDDSWACVADNLIGNVGILFVQDDFNFIKDKLEEFRRPSVAKAGAVAQADVRIESGPTSLDPSQTSFFQALGISTKIQKGTIEILSSVQLIKQGERVQASAAALLGKLNIKPFAYGIEITKVRIHSLLAALLCKGLLLISPGYLRVVLGAIECRVCVARDATCWGCFILPCACCHVLPPDINIYRGKFGHERLRAVTHISL